VATGTASARVPGILFGAALVTTLPILWIVALPVLDLQALPRHADHALLLFVHAVGGVAMLTLGAATLYIGWTRKLMRRHRWFGYSYLGLGTTGAVAALVLSIEAHHPNKGLFVATGTLALVWIGCAAMALRAALNRRFASHRQWMIRSYVLTWTFVGCRIVGRIPPFDQMDGEAVTALVWLNWILPLLICEVALQWRSGASEAKAH
jgi:hypothetical protein